MSDEQLFIACAKAALTIGGDPIAVLRNACHAMSGEFNYHGPRVYRAWRQQKNQWPFFCPPEAEMAALFPGWRWEEEV